jgi:hypothetical protein
VWVRVYRVYAYAHIRWHTDIVYAPPVPLSFSLPVLEEEIEVAEDVHRRERRQLGVYKLLLLLQMVASVSRFAVTASAIWVCGLHNFAE